MKSQNATSKIMYVWLPCFFVVKNTLMVKYFVNYGVWGGMGWVSHFVPIKTSIKHIYLKNYDQPIGNYTPCSLYSIQYDINQETAMSPRPTLQQRSPNFTRMLKLIHPITPNNLKTLDP